MEVAQEPGKPGPGLFFVNDDMPGISRKRRGRGFSYHAPDGTHIADSKEVERLNGIGLPPAYRDCWFCTLPNGHLLATGFDERRRKQYRYHPEYRSIREQDKFGRCIQFGEALADLRARVDADLRKRKLGRERALAAVVRLLDLGMVRVGNDRYAEENGSYGATTLLRSHVETGRDRLRLRYKAKSGRHREMSVCDRGLLRFVKQVEDLPGQRLFMYMDEDGEEHEIGSSQVNEYIRSAMGEGMSAKHFRTFHGSVLAYEALAKAESDLTIKQMVAPVSEALGNTPAISRSSYIHPRLIDLCAEDQGEWRADLVLPRRSKWLNRYERGFLEFLKE